jgi:hypothetical protein
MKVLVALIYFFLFEIQIYQFEIKHFRFGKKRKGKVMLIGRVTKAGSLPVLQQP